MKTDNLVESLRGYGIRANAYIRPPVEENIFALTIRPNHKEGVVMVNQGTAEVEVFGDKTKRQACVTVKEGGREVTRTIQAQLWRQDIRPKYSDILNGLRSHFPIVMPRNTKWSVRKSKVTPVPGRSNWWAISGEVTAKVGSGTSNHFLIGMDETHNFIAPLSKRATSVNRAHQLLRPVRLNKKALRQGEWFFDPCSKARQKQLDKIAATQPTRVGTRHLKTHQLMSCITVYRNNRQPSKHEQSRTRYARGYVIDRRRGHHKALLLPIWHKVVRNRETKVRVAAGQAALARRSTATWD